MGRRAMRAKRSRAGEERDERGRVGGKENEGSMG